METIDMLINEIESEVLKAKKAAFSNTDIVINKAVLLVLPPCPLFRLRTFRLFR